MADNRPKWMAYHKPEWMADYRPGWMADYRLNINVDQLEVPQDILNIIKCK
jgi:hypothetical protein